MKVVIIGNNVAGTFTAQNIRSLNNEAEIEIYTQEKYPYYTRINLPELISEKVTIDDLIVFKEDWYKNKQLNLHLNKKVNKINPSNKTIQIERENDLIGYDKLVLALGSTPNIPPIKNAAEMKDKNKGLFTLRNVDDALDIKDFIKSKKAKEAIIIGGGLLGLELANQINNSKLKTTVVEFFPRLLPRQLDEDCGGMLKEEIENRGIKVVLDAATEEILENGTVTGIRLKNGETMNGDIVLIQAGIRPIIDLAKKANLNTNRGIIVNEFLETSEKDIFAVGDCIEYKDQIWGIIPACMEQSKIVAASLLGLKKVDYRGTTPKNTLKIVGLELTSIGIIDPTKQEGGGWEILKKADKKDCCYQKLVLKNNKLKGAILFGENKIMSYVYNKMEEDVDKDELKKLLELYTYVCNNCEKEYDESIMGVLFKDLPDDFKCPGCKGPKEEFKKKNNE
ncbi:MAG: FAD-dependent oxidoreductase [Candidatus Lokiarchaeota archaeon]|nr:FAD-dependent oxidoreductase [Candidatus Lokiarchaeota archaeon]